MARPRSDAIAKLSERGKQRRENAGGKKMDNFPQNPRRSKMLFRIFERGAVGHAFSRPLTKAEADRLETLMNDGYGNGHGGIMFFDANGVAVGAHLCDCDEACLGPLLKFVADTGISLRANLIGDFNYTPASTWTSPETRVEITRQTTCAADELRVLQAAHVALQVSSQVVGSAIAQEQGRAAAHAVAKPRPQKRREFSGWGP